MFFFEIVNTILFSVRDKLIIVIKMSIFSFFNLLFILSLHLIKLITLTKFFDNIIILRFFHWIVSFNFVVWAFAIFVIFLFIIFAQIKNDDDDVKFVRLFVWNFEDIWDVFAIRIFLNACDVLFEFENFAGFKTEFNFFDVSSVDLFWIDLFSNRSIINFVIFCSMLFFNA